MSTLPPCEKGSDIISMTPERALECEQRVTTHEDKLRSKSKLDVLMQRLRYKVGCQEWVSLRSYTAALDLNRQFINGQRPTSVYHFGPLDDESKELIPGLLDLHDYGFLTWNSQPFQRAEPGVNGDPDKDGYWYDHRQRPYLQFLAPTKDRIDSDALDRFSDLLIADPHIVTLIVQAGKEPWGSLQGDHIVTEEKTALSIRELYAEEWEGFSCLSNVEEDGCQENQAREWGVKAIMRMECFEFQIASRSWDEELDLVRLVRDVAEEAGMGRVYAVDGEELESGECDAFAGYRKQWAKGLLPEVESN